MTMIEAGWDVRSRITSDAMERQDEGHRVTGKSKLRRDCMIPVIGLDISKEESHGQAFLERACVRQLCSSLCPIHSVSIL